MSVPGSPRSLPILRKSLRQVTRQSSQEAEDTLLTFCCCFIESVLTFSYLFHSINLLHHTQLTRITTVCSNIIGLPAFSVLCDQQTVPLFCSVCWSGHRLHCPACSLCRGGEPPILLGPSSSSSISLPIPWNGYLRLDMYLLFDLHVCIHLRSEHTCE